MKIITSKFFKKNLKNLNNFARKMKKIPELSKNAIPDLFEKKYQNSVFQVIEMSNLPMGKTNGQSTSTESLTTDKYRLKY